MVGTHQGVLAVLQAAGAGPVPGSVGNDYRVADHLGHGMGPDNRQGGRTTQRAAGFLPGYGLLMPFAGLSPEADDQIGPTGGDGIPTAPSASWLSHPGRGLGGVEALDQRRDRRHGKEGVPGACSVPVAQQNGTLGWITSRWCLGFGPPKSGWPGALPVEQGDAQIGFQLGHGVGDGRGDQYRAAAAAVKLPWRSMASMTWRASGIFSCEK